MKSQNSTYEKKDLLTRFQSDADAENAEKYGSGAMILGRPCRVEKATAHCEFSLLFSLLLSCEANNHYSQRALSSINSLERKPVDKKLTTCSVHWEQ